MIKLFISYAREDFDVANEFYNRIISLTSNSKVKFEIWFDAVELLPGQEWDKTIIDKIQKCNFFIALLSKKVFESERYVQYEIQNALNHLKKIMKDRTYLIPIRLDEVDLSSHEINKLHYEDYFPEKKDKEKAMNKVIQAIENDPKYFGRIERAHNIVIGINDFVEECKKSNENVIVRIRAAFTSMTNVSHHNDKEIPNISIDQKNELDNLLIQEKEAIDNLLSLKNVHLKCICWPKIRFLSKFYTEDERTERIKLFDSFLTSSMKQFIERREIIIDKFGSHGNQLIIGRKFAATANEESGGYTKSSIFDDQQMVDVLIKEYDNLFSLIKKNKFRFQTKDLETKKEKKDRIIREHIAMIEDAMSWFILEKKRYTSYIK